MVDPALLEVRDLRVSYASNRVQAPVLQNVSFTVQQGEIVMLPRHLLIRASMACGPEVDERIKVA